MTPPKNISPHETFELHELISFKNVCATKTATMAGLVHDDELKSILKQDVSMSQSQIRELQDLLKTSTYATEINSSSCTNMQ